MLNDVHHVVAKFVHLLSFFIENYLLNSELKDSKRAETAEHFNQVVSCVLRVALDYNSLFCSYIVGLFGLHNERSTKTYRGEENKKRLDFIWTFCPFTCSSGPVGAERGKHSPQTIRWCYWWSRDTQWQLAVLQQTQEPHCDTDAVGLI